MCDEYKINDECEEFEQDVDLDTTFIFPQVLSEYDVLGKHLIIAPEYANWLVCNDDEYKAFQLLRDGKSVREVEKLLGVEPQKAREIVSHLLAQIFAKDFSSDAEIREDQILNVLLRLTNGCNLRCTTCCFSCTVVGPDECTLDQWKKFLDALRDHDVEVLTLSGGEPMLNKDCIRIIEYAKKIGFKILLLTNGTLVNKENAKSLGENCDQVRVSIDGPDAETNDSVRGKGMFEKAISALRDMSPYAQCHLTIAMTPTPATLPAFQTSLRRFADWARETIRPDITFELTGVLMEGRDLPKMSRQEQATFLESVFALCNDQLEADFVPKLAAVNIVPNLRVLDCGLSGMIPVKANGDVGLCSFFPDALCNIKEIRDGSGKEFVANLAERLKGFVDSTRVDKLRPCAECDVLYFCGGSCRKKNEETCGDPNVCECDESFRQGLREKLVLANIYIIEPLTDLKEGGEKDEQDQD